jgi:hypothetical protein
MVVDPPLDDGWINFGPACRREIAIRNVVEFFLRGEISTRFSRLRKRARTIQFQNQRRGVALNFNLAALSS